MPLMLAGGDVRGHQRAMNASRYIPEIPEMFRKVSEANRVFIYNVGPFTHKRELGSAGTYLIPKCPDGKAYSEPLVIEGIEEEYYPVNEVECQPKPKCGEPGQLAGGAPGILLAMQILGEGPHVHRDSSFRPFGVFISSNVVEVKENGKTRMVPTPTEAELKKANKELDDRCVLMVRLAGEAYAMGPRNAAEVIQPDWHFVAARRLKKTVAECPWMANTSEPDKREECPSCGQVYKVGIMRCQCWFILDKPRYDKAVKDGLFAAA